jgi:hypothetical protein
VSISLDSSSQPIAPIEGDLEAVAQRLRAAISAGRPPVDKAGIENRPVIAALKRCATQKNQATKPVFQQTRTALKIARLSQCLKRCATPESSNEEFLSRTR